MLSRTRYIKSYNIVVTVNTINEKNHSQIEKSKKKMMYPTYDTKDIFTIDPNSIGCVGIVCSHKINKQHVYKT